MTTDDLIRACPDWDAFVEHAFVRQLASGTLPLTAFQYYLTQDYLYLIQHTRAWALAVYKADSLEMMRMAQGGLDAMLDTEIQGHLDFCAAFGLDPQAVKAAPEAPATVAYTRYVLDVGMTGSIEALLTALFVCFEGYAEIGRRFAGSITPDHPYGPWLSLYADPAFQAAANTFKAQLDARLKDHLDPQGLQRVFDTACRMEIAFWQMGLDAA